MTEPLRVAVVGCGNISEQYLRTLTRTAEVSVVAVADRDDERAARTAAAHGVRAVPADQVYGLDEVEWVLDLTTPGFHEDVALAAIAHGRSVYNEKPLCSTLAAGQRVVAAAAAAGVVVAAAPDTVHGTGIQTARAVIDSGQVGQPVFATATLTVPGHERWHPDPDFFYAPGGGPLLDLGPYYLTALVTLLGPIVSVQGATSRARSERVIGTGPRAGERIPVTVDTHATALIEHEGGALTTLLISFEGVATRASQIEVHGQDASLVVPDPNEFDGPVLRHALGGDWELVEPSAGYAGAGRGIGLVDVARSADRRTAAASGELGLHVLDAMESITQSATDGTRHRIGSRCTRPAPVPLTRF